MSKAPIRIKPIALPVEHGGWAFLLEPIVLGILLAPSLAALFLSLGAMGFFLARHPFKLAVADWRNGRRSPRTAYAQRFAALYTIIGIFGLALAVKTGGTAFLLPLLLAVPLGSVQLFHDAKNRSRALIAELAGSTATASLVSAILLAGGWPPIAAYGLWLILAARNVPTILYVRTKLKVLHRQAASRWPAIIAHLLAITIAIGLAWVGAAPLLAFVALAILLVRAVIGLSDYTRQMTAKKVGRSEVGFGLLTVFAVFLGHLLQW